MAIISIAFKLAEAAAFLLPALPNSRNVRLSILFAYWVGHVCGLPKTYLRIKHNTTDYFNTRK